VWPAFYTDVTDAYRLGKWGRLRTDLGGVYFNAVFALTVAGIYALTGFEPLLLLVLLQNFAILQQLLPLLRLDGYYIISDLTGVPDMLGRIRPILTSALPWRRTDEEVAKLKPWVRVAVTGYVAAIVPVLAFAFVMMLIQAPRVFATAYDSLGVRWDAASAAFGSGKAVDGIANGLQMAGLVLPALGVALTSGRVGHRAGGAAWAWSAGAPLRRALVVLPAVAALGLAAFVWWPNGDYKPIQPNERGTVQGGLRSLADVGTGRPALTPQRERQLHGAPGKRHATSTRPQQLRGPAGTGQERPATTTPAAPPSDQSTTPEPAAGATPTTTTPPPTTETAPAAPAPSDPNAAPAGSAPAPTPTTP
jgi:putative peptide zinc metalloprotease protein